MSDLTFRSIARSNMPVSSKASFFEKWLATSGDRYTAAMARVGASGVATAHVVRQYGEAGITGMALAALAVHLPSGLDIGGKAPIDLGIALIGAGVAIGMPHEDVATDARNIGAVAGGIYAFRQTGKYLATKLKAEGKALPAGGTFSGDDDENEWRHPSMTGDVGTSAGYGVDPVVDLASKL